MSSNLSQEEINALLNITDDSSDDSAEVQADMQEDEALESAPIEEAVPVAQAAEPQAAEQAPSSENDVLTKDEKDAIGEIGNISMGTSATTLYTLLNRRVNITTPTVTAVKLNQLVNEDDMPLVMVEVGYTEGLDGNNVLLLREKDVKIITDLLMGGDGTNTEDELSELHISAISEVMNQMIASSAISIAAIVQEPINIAPPICRVVRTLEDVQNTDFYNNEEYFICTSFNMEVDDLIKSDIKQLMPLYFGKALISNLLGSETGAAKASANKEIIDTMVYDTSAHVSDTITQQLNDEIQQMQVPPQQPVQEQLQTPPPQPAPVMPQEQPQIMQQPAPMPMQQPMQQPLMQQPMANDQSQYIQMLQQQMQMMQQQMQQQMQQMQQMQSMQMQSMQTQPPQVQQGGGQQMAAYQVETKPVQYQSFGTGANDMAIDSENLNLVMDVPLQVTIELGRTKRSIKEILDMNLGSVIVLDKLAGEPVEIYVNGKLIAKSEVVVIDDNYGVRITDIFSAPKNLLNG